MFVKVWHEVNLLNGLSISQQLVCDRHAHRPLVDFVFLRLKAVACARVSSYSLRLDVFFFFLTVFVFKSMSCLVRP